MKNGRYLIKRKNKKNVSFCLFLAFFVVGSIFTTGSYYGSNIYFKLNDITVEIGDKLPDEVVNYPNLIDNFNNLQIETNAKRDDEDRFMSLGKFSYYLVYDDDNFKNSKFTNVKASLTVIDTVKPTITILDKKEFDYGSKVKADDIAECNDLSGCKLYFEEEIDTNKSGTHEVKIVAEDAAKNKTKIETTITIKEKPIPVYYYYTANYSYMNNNNNEINKQLTEDEKINLRNQIVEYAKLFIGNPYVYGGTSLTNGTDCSGFTMSIYANFGYTIPRSAPDQGFVGMNVNANELIPGDIIVYHYATGGGHVGIYVSPGMMVHAGTEATGIVLAPIFDGYRTYTRIIY